MSATEISVSASRELRAICGDDYVRERPSGGTYISPGSAEEVAAVLAFANQQRLSVGPAGGSTERSAGELQVDILLHLNRFTQVEHYDHADLTVGVGAGVTVAQLNAMVGADRLMFAADPPSPERCMVGGLLATAGHGPLRHGYGGVRDFCIGIRFVTGDGRRAKGGGRVVKNVAGYDLMKLLIGSYGTLAVITSASFKLFPLPRQTRSFLGEFASSKEALKFRDHILRSPLSPMCLELVSPGARKLMRPEMTNDAWVICLRTSGSDTVLARYRNELGTAITRELEGENENRMWRAIENFAALPDGDSSLVVELSVWPREVQAAIDTLLDTSALGDIDVSLMGRVGVGHLLVKLQRCGVDRAEITLEVTKALRKKLGNNFAIKVRGAGNPWPIEPVSLSSMRAVKQALDPNNVLRGREIF